MSLLLFLVGTDDAQPPAPTGVPRRTLLGVGMTITLLLFMGG